MMEQRRVTKYITRTNANKMVYYFSLEFLLGRMLKNNLMSIGAYDVVKEGLKQIGVDIEDLEDLEADPGLGNGGLGRLAACFLDSMADLDYPGNGNTIRYRNGLFKQLIVKNEQVEVPDQWLLIDCPWEVRKPDKAIDVRMYGSVEVTRDEKGELIFHRIGTEHVLAVPYDMPIVGVNSQTGNTLRMWSAEPSELIPHDRDYRKYLSDVDDICLNLYPDDSTREGKMLRVKQEYFFVAAGIGSIIADHLRNYKTLDNLADKVVIQLNDTHPAMAIPELMRILIDNHGYAWNDAWEITKKVFAYTNHTVMQEALEKWPCEYIKTIVPRIYMIIEEIDDRFRFYLRHRGKSKEFIDSVGIIQDNHVRMANLSIVGSFSVNGVAKIHSEIIKNDTFHNLHEVYPEKFNNKTNGVTPRRWLFYANTELCDLIERYIGPDFRGDFNRIGDLLQHVDNPELQEAFLAVKEKKKEDFAHYLHRYCGGLEIDPNSIFDVQIKRLHAYKRQLLNILYVMSLYFRIKEDPSFRMVKTTFVFGAKAATSYYFAKKVIKLINCVSEVIRKDPEVSKYINVVFVPNYRVTVAEKLIPAADISEQISTAGKEASGTGNMKLMMNGAFTLGTLDGANVEISNLVGDENCVIFGLHEDEITELKHNGYRSFDYYDKNPRLKQVVDSLLDCTWSSDRNDFKVIYDELLINNDEYMVMADFEAYCKAHEKTYEYYNDPHAWAKKCLINIAKSAYFSSDRTIEEYVRDIWHLTKVHL